MDEVVQSSRLIIDKFVEAGTFGEDWEQLFLETTNELAETVLPASLQSPVKNATATIDIQSGPSKKS